MENCQSPIHLTWLDAMLRAKGHYEDPALRRQLRLPEGGAFAGGDGSDRRCCPSSVRLGRAVCSGGCQHLQGADEQCLALSSPLAIYSGPFRRSRVNSLPADTLVALVWGESTPSSSVFRFGKKANFYSGPAAGSAAGHRPSSSLTHAWLK